MIASTIDKESLSGKAGPATCPTPPPIDTEAIKRHVELFRGAGGLLSLVRMEPGTGRLNWLAFVESSDVDQLAYLAGMFALSGDCYMVANPFRPDAVQGIKDRHGRGAESELHAVTGFVADIDGGKPGTDYPSQAVVKAMLARLPIHPNMVNISGRRDGGVHAYWTFPEPVILESDSDRQRVKAVARRLCGLIKSELAGFKFDTTPLLSLVQPFRVAGTRNWKYGTTVRTIFESKRRTALEDFERLLPPEPEPVRPRVTAIHRRMGFHDFGHVQERARRYLEAIPGAVDGQGGHVATFKVAGALVWGFDLTPDDAFPLLAEWNETCSPPWTEYELFHKLRWADEREPRGRERGYLLNAERPGSNGKPINGTGSPFAQWTSDGRLILTAPAGFVFAAMERPAEDQDGQPVDAHTATAGPPEPTATAELEERTLDEWRADEMREHIESLDCPGTINMSHSPPGSGKSYAGWKTAGASRSSLLIVQTHKNAAEVAKSMAALEPEIIAVPFPALTEKTCLNYSEASAAMTAGLSPSAAVCVACDHSDECDYREMMAEAEMARHSIATHHRSTFSLDHLAKNKQLIVIEENAADLLAPASEVQGGLEPVERLAQSGKITSDPTEWSYFSALESAAQWLTASLREAVTTTPLTTPAPAAKPRGIDRTLFNLIKDRKRQGAILPDSTALRICRAVVEGTLKTIGIRVDVVPGKGNSRVETRSIYAVRELSLPRHAVTWIHDGTADPEEIQGIAGRAVTDRTPRGMVARKNPVWQFPIDVTKTCSSRTFLAVLRGLIAAFPAYQRIGLICHQTHTYSALGTSKKINLEPELRKRLSKIEYFFSGETRGSNAFLETCDALFVVGTPRPKQSLIKNRLLRRPDTCLYAGVDGGWGPITWTGRDSSGNSHTVTGLGYSHPQWSAAHRSAVHSELKQAVGRGRSILETGIPVILATTENLDFPLADFAAPPIWDAEMRTVQEMKAIAVELGCSSVEQPSATLSIEKGCSGPTIAKRINRTPQLVRKNLAALASAGLIEKISDREGWRFTERGAIFVGLCSPGNANASTDANADASTESDANASTDHAQAARPSSRPAAGVEVEVETGMGVGMGVRAEAETETEVETDAEKNGGRENESDDESDFDF